MSIYNSKQQEKYEKTQKVVNKIESKKDSLEMAKVKQSKDSSLTDTARVETSKQLANEYGVLSNALVGTEKLITIENEDCIFTFSNKGGILKKVELKQYKTYSQKPLILFDQTADDFNYSFVINSAKKKITTSNLYFKSNTENQVLKGDDKTQVEFAIEQDGKKLFSQSYTIPGKGYMLDFNVDASGISNEIPKTAEILTLSWNQQLKSHEKSIKDERISSGIYYQDHEKHVDDLGLMKDKDEVLDKKLNWISFSQKFFNTTILAKTSPFLANSKVKTIVASDDDTINVKQLTAQLETPLNSSNKYIFEGQLFTGPSSYGDLRKLKNGMHEIIPIGGSVLGWVNRFLVIPTINFLHKFISNYGVIILLLSIFIKLITLPFTYKSQLSMIKMRLLKPELDELREKYGKDQATFGAKQMELYQQTGVSPFGGCLPMLLQWPFLIAMYRFFPSALQLRQEKFLWAEDLSTYDSLIHLPFKIPILGDHLSIFALLGVVTSFGMTLYTMKMQPQQANAGGGEFAEAMQKQMKIMQYFFPFMILFFFNSSSSALSYYFFLYNGLTLVQQWIMSKFFIDENALRAQIEHNKKNPKKKSNFQMRMEEMMKQQQELKNRQKK